MGGQFEGEDAERCELLRFAKRITSPNAEPGFPVPTGTNGRQRVSIYVPSISFRTNEWDPSVNCITVIKTTKTVGSALWGAALRLDSVHNPAPLFRCLARGAC